MKVFLKAGILMTLIPIAAAAQLRRYQPQPIAPVSFQNSSRIESLMRAGRLYLSLADAVALALEITSISNCSAPCRASQALMSSARVEGVRCVD